jgi:hypothetical protein
VAERLRRADSENLRLIGQVESKSREELESMKFGFVISLLKSLLLSALYELALISLTYHDYKAPVFIFGGFMSLSL